MNSSPHTLLVNSRDSRETLLLFVVLKYFPDVEYFSELFHKRSFHIMASRSSIKTETPTVVCIRVSHLRPRGYANLDDWLKDPTHVYIGGKLSHPLRGGKGISDEKWDKWSNPYKDEKNRTVMLEKYTEYALNNLVPVIPELDSATELGDWCENNDYATCHGHILVKLLNMWRRGELQAPTRSLSRGDRGESASAGTYRQRETYAKPDYNKVISNLPEPGVEDQVADATRRIERLNITRRITARQPTPLPDSLVRSIRESILTDPNDNFSAVDSERVQLLDSLFYGFSRASNETLTDIVAYIQESFAGLYQDEQ